VATTIEGTLKPSSYRKPKRLEKMKPPRKAPMMPTKRLVSRRWLQPVIRSASHPAMMPTTIHARMLMI
jgi:hypothetical protein